MDYKELSTKIRSKYPGAYDDMDDATLAKSIVGKYPQYADTTFDDPAPSPAPTGEPTLAESAVSAIQPEVTGPPQEKESFLTRLARGTRQMFFPKDMDEVKSAFNPNLGQFGVAKILEEEGKRVGASVRGSLEGAPGPVKFVGDVLSDQLTPSAMQQNLGAEVLGQFAAPAIKGMVKGTSKVSELLTGTPASTFKRLADDPAAILPEMAGGSMGKKKAGALLGQAEKDAGFVPTVLEPETGKAAGGLKSFEGKTSPFKGDQGLADAFYERVAKGEQLAPQEALEAYKATSRNLSKMSRKDARYVEMLRFEKALGSELEALSPEYAAAKKQYARAALGDAVTNVLPRTATGKVSQGRLGFNALIFGGGSIINPAALTGLALGSPVLHGAGTAALGAASKLASTPGVPTGVLATLSASARRALESKRDATPKKASPGRPIRSASKRAFDYLTTPEVPDTTSAYLKTPDGSAYAKGLRAFQKDDIEGAKKSWMEALKINRKNYEARNGLERIADREGKERDFYTRRPK